MRYINIKQCYNPVSHVDLAVGPRTEPAHIPPLVLDESRSVCVR